MFEGEIAVYFKVLRHLSNRRKKNRNKNKITPSDGVNI